MHFSERQETLLKAFDPSVNINKIEDSGLTIHFLPFQSGENNGTLESSYLPLIRQSIPGAGSDEEIGQNKHFVYPVFMPRERKGNRVIIMLHGLNERKWDKYLAWAHYLAEETGKPVILFPTSFHINRSLPDWLDPHHLNARVIFRRQDLGLDPHLSTFVNLALSERLTETPERFFLSGLQTATDLQLLLSQLMAGTHPLFPKGTGSDFFAYSIGGLLAQVMLISNPGGLLTGSKVFLFCAGSLFSQMNGISRVIIDPAANERIQNYYKNELEEKIKTSGVFAGFFNDSQIGMAFRSMIAPDRFRKIREKVFRKQARQIFAVALKNDRVIPPSNIMSTLSGRNRIPENMEVYDFNYPYSHEMPFPLKMTHIRDLVDEAFEKIFRKAAVFLG